MEKYYNQLVELGIAYGPKVLLAIIALIVGLPLIKLIIRLLERALDRKHIDATVKPFLLGTLRILLKFALLIVIAQTLGIKTTSFVAIIGAAGLAIALSLKDTLGNFAASFLILFFRPYKIGDYIEAQGFSGTVKEIQTFATVLLTPDNKKITIPNGAIYSGPIINYSAETNRRVDMTFGIAYEDEIAKAKSIIQDLIHQDNRIMEDPESFIGVSELADSSVNIVVRMWCKKEDYWGIFFDMQEKVKTTFDAQGISIPYPQRVIHQGA